jgi:hypothetical protein
MKLARWARKFIAAREKICRLDAPSGFLPGSEFLSYGHTATATAKSHASLKSEKGL